MNTINKITKFLKDFYNNIKLIEMILLVMLIYVNLTESYPALLSMFLIWMIVDIVLDRIKKNKLKK